MRRFAGCLAVLVVLVGVGEAWALPMPGDIISWHASSGVLPDDPSIPPERRFNITEQQSVVLHERDYLEVSDTVDSVKVKIENSDADSIQAGDPYAYQIELRMNSHERHVGPDFGVSFGVEDLGRAVEVVVATDRVAFWQWNYSSEDWHAMDTTDDFHSFRVVKDLPTVSLFVDSFETPVLTIPYSELPLGGPSSVEMAETSSYGTANFDIRSFAYNLNGTVIPEPSTLVLLGMGAVGLLVYAWRRRRS